MKNGTKILLVAVLAIAALIFVFWDKLKGAFTKTSAAINNAANTVTGKTTTPAGPTFPLHNGSHGTEVKNLQRFLNWTADYGLAVDGAFGNHTEQAVFNETGFNDVPEAYYTAFVLPYINGEFGV